MSTLCAGAVLCFLAALHPDSRSFSEFRVRGESVRTRLRFQIQNVIEIHPAADVDRDGALSEHEINTAIPVIREAILRGLTVRDGRTPLRGRFVGHESVRTADARGVESVTHVTVFLEFAGEGPVRAPVIRFDLFFEGSPDHRDTCVVILAPDDGGPVSEVHHVFHGGDRVLRCGEPTPAGEQFRLWLGEGIHHFATGYDHIAFVIALILLAPRLLPLLGIVTAFTLGHSATLLISTLSRPLLSPDLAEPLIALSIAWVAAENLAPGGHRGRPAVALFFGLVHGMGFATVLREGLLGEGTVLLPLLGFNLGVEVGQAAAVLLVWPLLLLLRSRPGLHSVVVRVGSGALLALGLWWFVDRV